MVGSQVNGGINDFGSVCGLFMFCFSGGGKVEYNVCIVNPTDSLTSIINNDNTYISINTENKSIQFNIYKKDGHLYVKSSYSTTVSFNFIFIGK